MIKRIGCIVLACWLLLTAMLPLTASAAYPLPENTTIVSRSAIVVFLGADATEDMIMYEKNPDERLAPAGMVRVLVGLYALQTMEEQNIDPAIATGTYTEDIYNTIAGTGLYTVGMEYGDVWRVEDLLNIAMVQTAADAVGTLVTALAGTQTRYVEGMNALAAELGCTNTHVSNVYGLDAPDQYTTARDMYTILRYATLRYPQMIEMLSQPEYETHPVKGEGDIWPTTNEMLRIHSEFYYEPLVLGRSGYTDTVGQSCASIARDDGYEFLTVVMGAKDEADTAGLAFTDSMTLYRWVYNSFDYQTIISKGQPISRLGVELAWNTDSVVLVAAAPLQGMLREELEHSALRYDIQMEHDTLEAPVEKGQVCGTAYVYDGEELIGSVELVAAEAVGRSQILAIADAVWKVISSPVMLVVLGALVLLLIGYIILSVVHNRNRRNKKQKRVKRYK